MHLERKYDSKIKLKVLVYSVRLFSFSNHIIDEAIMTQTTTHKSFALKIVLHLRHSVKNAPIPEAFTLFLPDLFAA